jgi:chromate reductase, NAD(P)H dehydrogenase (quinone)
MITIISGTNRAHSKSRAIAELYGELLSNRQIENTILDLADLPIDFIHTALYHNSGTNDAFNQVAAAIAHSQKFVFVVPEYNGSFPGVLKAFIDGLGYPQSFRNKKAALVGHSSGSQGGILALSHLTDIFNYLGMHVLAKKVRLPQLDKNLAGNTLTHSEYRRFLEEQVELFLEF